MIPPLTYQADALGRTERGKEYHMSVGSPTDALFGACHVVGRIPALGVAICMGFGGAVAGVIPVTLTNPPQVQSTCTDGTEFFLIDIGSAGQNASVGDCVEDPDIVTRAELRAQCLLPAAKNEEICAQI